MLIARRTRIYQDARRDLGHRAPPAVALAATASLTSGVGASYRPPATNFNLLQQCQRPVHCCSILYSIQRL